MKKEIKKCVIDKTSVEWCNLFKDKDGNPVSSDRRCIIKDLSNRGYTIEEIKEILESFREEL